MGPAKASLHTTQDHEESHGIASPAGPGGSAQHPARPRTFTFDPTATALVVIDMQRDFLEPGGFGELLGNDVGLLARVVTPLAGLLDAARAAGPMVIHTREGHRPDLADCPPAKLARGGGETTIGSPGPRGRILVRGEEGHDIVDELAPADGEVVLDKPGKGALYATDLELLLRQPADREPDRHRRHHRGLRAHDGPRGQRPRLRVLRP
jgi:nicotinamidase-related amidase